MEPISTTGRYPGLLNLNFCANRQLTWRVECDCVFQVEQKSAGPVFRNARAPTRVVSILFFQLIFRDNSNLKTKIVVLFSLQISVEIVPKIIKSSYSWCPQCDDPKWSSHFSSNFHDFWNFYPSSIKFFFNTSTWHDRILISVSVGLYPHQLRGHDRQSHCFSPDIKPANTAQLTKHSWLNSDLKPWPQVSRRRIERNKFPSLGIKFSPLPPPPPPPKKNKSTSIGPSYLSLTLSSACVAGRYLP